MVGAYGQCGCLSRYGSVPFGKGDGGWHADQLAAQRAADTRIAFFQEHEKAFVGAALAGGVLIAALIAFSGPGRRARVA